MAERQQGEVMDLEALRARREALARRLEALAGSEVLPLKLEGALVERDTLLGWAEDLRAGRFVVAVAGQMNSGKSTLLNALIFGEPVLPMAATVTTAKITVLEHAGERSAEVTFYSEQEWAEVERAFRERPEHLDEQAWEESRRAWNEHVEAAARQGESARRYVGRPPERLEDLSALRRYVTSAEQGGLLTPFVKQVTIRHDAEAFRDVVVVDTPGINDPNPVRDRLTKDWIKEASAVVYVTYAGQAGLDKTDLRFMDTYLQGVPPSLRVLAVNKADGVDEGAVRRYLERLASSDNTAIRAVIGEVPAEARAIVSGIAGLVVQMRERGLPLDEALEEMLEHLEDEAPEWLERLGGIPELRACIERRLVAGARGLKLLVSFEQRLEALRARAVRTAALQVERKRKQLDDVAGDLEQRRARREQIERDLARMAEAREQLPAYLQEQERQLLREVHPVLSAAERQLRRAGTRHVRAAGSLEELARIGYVLRAASEEVERELAHSVERAAERFREAASAERLAERFPALESLGREELEARLEAPAGLVAEEVYDALSDAFSDELFEQVVDEAQGWFAGFLNKIFGSNFGLDDARREVRAQLELLLEDVFEGGGDEAPLAERVGAHLSDLVREHADGILRALAAEMEERRTRLGELEADAKRAEEERKKREDELRQAEARLRAIEAAFQGAEAGE